MGLTPVDAFFLALCIGHNFMTKIQICLYNLITIYILKLLLIYIMFNIIKKIYLMYFDIY